MKGGASATGEGLGGEGRRGITVLLEAEARGGGPARGVVVVGVGGGGGA